MRTRPHLLYIEPEWGESDALYQNPDTTSFSVTSMWIHENQIIYHVYRTRRGGVLDRPLPESGHYWFFEPEWRNPSALYQTQGMVSFYVNSQCLHVN